jgi:hypothetical protein
MEYEGYDAMRRMIRHRVAALGIRGFGPAERFIAAPLGWRDQPRPPMSPIVAFDAIEGAVNPDAWIHAFMAESAPKHHHELSLFYPALIPCAHDHLARVGRELAAAATPLERLIETRAA